MVEKRFGSEWHSLAPNAAAPLMATTKVHATGLEPVTFGSVVRTIQANTIGITPEIAVFPRIPKVYDVS
jgi:hypothetical protein